MTRASVRDSQNSSPTAEPDAARTSRAATQTSAPPAPSPLQPALPHSEPTLVSTRVYLRLKLENLLLSPKTRNVLAAHNVQTLGQLCRLSATQLAALPSIGLHSLSELHETLDYYGVSLAPEPTSRSNGKKHAGPLPLCLPGLEPRENWRVCRGCQKPLVSAPTSGGFCSAACRQSTRLIKLPMTVAPPTGLQLVLPLMPEE